MWQVYNTFFNTLEPIWKSDLHCPPDSTTSETASYPFFFYGSPNQTLHCKTKTSTRLTSDHYTMHTMQFKTQNKDIDLVIHYTEDVVSDIKLIKHMNTSEQHFSFEGSIFKHSDLRIPRKWTFKVPKPTVVHHLKYLNRKFDLHGSHWISPKVDKRNRSIIRVIPGLLRMTKCHGI